MATGAAPILGQAECLAVVLDLGPSHAAMPSSQLSSLIDQTLTFLNAYTLLSSSNQLLVLAPHPRGVRCLWPPADAMPDAVAAPANPAALRASVLAGMRSLTTAASDGESTALSNGSTGGSGSGSGDTVPLLSAALAAAICRLQRVRRLRPRIEARLLVLHASADAPAQHLASMNCVFAAQKLGMLIDCVVISAQGQDSMVLQQAAHLTGGLYLRPDAQTVRALAQYLISCCLPDRSMRELLQPPRQGQPETRALCFETQLPVDMGYACSVCLAVFNHGIQPEKFSSCPVCGTRFTAPVQPGQQRKKLKKPAAPSAAK